MLKKKKILFLFSSCLFSFCFSFRHASFLSARAEDFERVLKWAGDAGLSARPMEFGRVRVAGPATALHQALGTTPRDSVDLITDVDLLFENADGTAGLAGETRGAKPSASEPSAANQSTEKQSTATHASPRQSSSTARKASSTTSPSSSEPSTLLAADPAPADPKPQNYSGATIPTTPRFLGKLYQIPAGLADSGLHNNRVSLASFQAGFSTKGVEAYTAVFGIEGGGVDKVVGEAPAVTVGPSLDAPLQALTGIAAGVDTWVWNMGPGKWVLEWAQEVLATKNPPLTHVLTSSLSEYNVCSAGLVKCTSTEDYVRRANTALASLASMGLTVVAAAGDDGNIGNNPHCPIALGPDSNVLCGSFAVTLTDNGHTQSCIYPAGAASCPIVTHPDCKSALSFFFESNAAEPCQARRDYFPWDPAASDTRSEPGEAGAVKAIAMCTCDRLAPSKSGLCTVTGYSYSKQTAPAFGPSFPGSSPYVLSVGATKLDKQDLDACASGVCREMGASRQTKSTFTSGGGFSLYAARPAWQSDFVGEYLGADEMAATLPPAELYRPGNRGFPDVAALGTACLFADDAGVFTVADGSACAAATVGGMMALLNGRLLGRGSRPLGLPNAWLYEMAAATPEAFHDVILGDGCCSREYCCRYCFYSYHGWDPASGLGTPSFSTIAKYMDATGSQFQGLPLSRKYGDNQIKTTQKVPEHERVSVDEAKRYSLWVMLMTLAAAVVVSALATIVACIRARGTKNSYKPLGRH